MVVVNNIIYVNWYSKGHYESDDETGFFFKQLREIQLLLDGIFETETLDGEKENAKKEK